MVTAWVVAACSVVGPAAPPSSKTTSTPGSTTSSVPDSSGTADFPTGSLGAGGSPSPGTSIGGFVFLARDIVGYYQTLGYVCTDEAPSQKAAGFLVRICSLVDPAGRTRGISVITDGTGLVAAGIASMAGASGETILDPSVALEPLAAFLGAMLGQEQGAAVVSWLASHLGDADSRTIAGPVTITTYTDGPDLHAKLYLELDSATYLAATGGKVP